MFTDRVIKFRAYSIATGKMMDWDFISSVRNLNKLLTLDHVRVMQFTGLHDKNGNEIYEGDIVKDDHTVFEVVFHSSSWNFKRVSGSYQTPYFHNNCSRMRIIGNIYENNSLIK